MTNDGHGRRDLCPSVTIVKAMGRVLEIMGRSSSRFFACVRLSSKPILVALFKFLRKPNDPVDRQRSEMIGCLGWGAREIRKHQRDVRDLEVRAAAEADL